MAIFAVWFGFRTAKIWRSGITGGGGLDTLLARAATIVIVLLLVHALVDYALRTTAVMSLFAFCSALLLPAPQTAAADAERTIRREGAKPRRRETEPSLSIEPVSRQQNERNDERLVPPAPEAPHVAPRRRPAPSQVKTSQTDTPNPLAPSEPGTKWKSDVAWPEAWRSPDNKQ
jgi:hypothetical protein